MSDCVILLTTPTGQLRAGTVTLDGGAVRATAQPGYASLLRNILAIPVGDGRKAVTAVSDPKAWFAGLPRMYSGTYLRAVMDDVAKYSDDEPRDERGRWASGGARNARGEVFVSPNTGNLTFDEAVEAMHGDRHAEVRRMVEGEVGKFTPGARVSDILGVWSDGAENSLMVEGNVKDRATLRYMAARMGDSAGQKAVIPFSVNARGRDTMWTIRTQVADLKATHAALNASGIENHSLEPAARGLNVHVFDIGSQLAAKVRDAAARLGGKVDLVKGSGEFLGGETVGEGHEAYMNVIRSYEARHHAAA